MRFPALPVLGALALAACHGAESPTAAVPAEAPARAIAHWSNWEGAQGFYFLPGTPPEGGIETAFDPNVSPTVTVCRLAGSTCGATVATFTRTSGSYGRRIAVDAAERAYEVSWPTFYSGVRAGEVYRVAVRVGTRELGFMDVQVLPWWTQAPPVDTSQYRAVYAGFSFPISFRINRVPGSIVLSSTSLSLGVGEGVPLTAQVLDLSGQPLAEEVYWFARNASEAPGAVVEVDSGLVVGKHAGTATLYALAWDVVVPIPVTVADNRRAWTRLTTPDQENRAVWGTSASNLFAANHTGILRNAGGSWAHVEAVRWRSMHDVFGLGANDVWAVGDAGTILRFDGAAWSSFRFDGASVQPFSLAAWDVPARKITLRALWSSSGLVAAVGDSGTALYYDGAAWNVVPTGTTADLTDVWGSGLSDVYVTTGDGRLLRFNGSTIAPVAAVRAQGRMRAVWGTSASNVYAAGDGGALFRFNGSSWTRIRLPTRGNLYAVWGTSASNVYVAGEGGMIYRWDGTRWTPEKIPGEHQVYAVWGLSSTDVYAVGAGGIAKR